MDKYMQTLILCKYLPYQGNNSHCFIHDDFYVFCRKWKDNILMHFADVGKKPPAFVDTSLIAQEILNSGYDFDHGELYYNVYK